MMTDDEVSSAVDTLDKAEKTQVQTGLLSLKFPRMTMDDAYKVQKMWVRKKILSGQKVIGWKIGLTSKAMQYALNIDIPDSGVLLDDMKFVNKSTIPAGRFIQPRIEAEIAFVMKASLSGDVTVEDVKNATDYVAPSLEILDTRVLRVDPDTGQSRVIVDTISDNAANAGVILGSERHSVDSFDLRRVGAIVSRNNEVEETGLGAGVLGDPILGIVWLAKRMAQYDQKIEPGQIILSGSFIRAIEAHPGSHIFADFGDFGNVSVDFGN
jgi:2-oxo-hept-3-ene-1,7-dioate hydratase